LRELLVDKYDDGLPLHRQKRRRAHGTGVAGIHTGGPGDVEHGIFCGRSGGQRCRRCWRRESCIWTDGPAGAGPQRCGRQASGRLWGYAVTPTWRRTFSSRRGRSRGNAKASLAPRTCSTLRTGYTVADASNLFDKSFKREDLVECGCNMHARRYFVKALDGADARAAAAHRRLQEAVRDRGRNRDKDEDAKRAARTGAEQGGLPTTSSHGAGPISRTSQPSSALGKAIQYALNHREALARFLEHGAIPIDKRDRGAAARARGTHPKELSLRGVGRGRRARGDRVHHPGLLPPCGR